MALGARRGLNVSGEAGVSRMFSRAALHLSRGQRTTSHAHYAWKLHVGLDAPVWLESAQLSVAPTAGVRGILVPPNFEHATGAVGCSLAVFIAPGSRAAPWRGDDRPLVLEGRVTARLLHMGLRDADRRQEDLVDQIARELFSRGDKLADPRVAYSLEQLHLDPGFGLGALAEACGVSLDHLSRLVRRDTGLVLRRHVLWSRLLRALAQPATGLANLAAHAGFADHAHLTRTFRACLGRAPSDFTNPPQIVAPW